MFCNYLLYYTTMECSTTNTLHTAKEFSGPFSNMDLMKLKSVIHLYNSIIQLRNKAPDDHCLSP